MAYLQAYCMKDGRLVYSAGTKVRDWLVYLVSPVFLVKLDRPDRPP